MHAVTDQIIPCLSRIREPAKDAESLSQLQTILSPWAVWLLFALVRQVERQRWVSSVIVSKLGADISALSLGGWLAHPNVPTSGLVPDLQSWEYELHGRGCRLTNRITGESIDVDFYDGSADWIDDYFFVEFLRSLKNPEPIEKRLIELHPSQETVILAFGELLNEGVVARHPEAKVVQPLEELLALSERIDLLNGALNSPATLVLAARLLGDWLLVDKCVPNSQEIKTLSAACVTRRRSRLESSFAAGKSDRLALIALCDLLPDPTDYMSRALKQSPSGMTSEALELAFKRPKEDWTLPVYDLLCRTDPSGDIPRAYTWTRCAQYLLERQSHVQEIRAQIRRVGRRALGDVAILALEHFPDIAGEFFHRALRSDVPVDRNTAAAALAIIDRPWSHQILLALLNESRDQERTAETRAALMATPHQPLHEAVSKWERTNPHEPETGEFITMTELSLRGRDSWMQHEIEFLHGRVIKLRSINPGAVERRRKWWPF